jgi:iron complex outermembrane receptor protein
VALVFDLFEISNQGPLDVLRGCIHRKDAIIDSDPRVAVTSRRHRFASVIFALLVVGGVPTSFAADDNETASSSPSLEEVTVTAQKRPENLQDVPLAVSAIDGEALVNRQANNLLDLQGLVPNTTVQQRLSSGVVTIRGIGFDIVTAGADSSVAVNSDGVYISRPPAALTGLYDIDRIEVVRGPQSTLYGRNSTGGAINIVTNKPTADTEGFIDVGVGNYDAVNLEAALGRPIVQDKLLARIAVKTDDHGGYGTNLYNGDDIDNLHSRAMRAELLLNATEKINFLLKTDFFWESDSAFAFHYLGPYTPNCSGSGAAAILVCPATHGFVAPNDPFDVDQDAQTVDQRRFYGTSLTSTFNFDWAKLVAITAAYHTHSYYLGDLDGTSLQLAKQGITREEDADQFSQELQLSGEAARTQWLLGLYYFHETDFARATAYFAPPVPAPLVGPYFQGANLTTDAYAAFGQATYHFTDVLSATVGGRFSDETHQIANEQLKLGVTDTFRADLPLADQATFDAFTPRTSLEYKYDRDGLAYVTIQKGFKSGGFAAGSLQPAFQPETIWDYEVGIKSTWLQDRLLSNLAAFHYDYRNLQEGIVAGTSTIIGNVPKAKVDGFEVETKMLLGKHFSVDANGGYLDARFGAYSTLDSGRNNALFVLGGNSLSQAPRVSGTLGAQYVFPIPRGDLTLRGEGYGSSRVYFTPFNVPINSQSPYTLENAYLTWDNAGSLPSVSVFVKNIADKAIVSSSFVSAAFVGAAVDAALLPPRTFGANVRWKF